MVYNFLKITVKRITLSKKFLIALIYLICIPLLVIKMNDWSQSTNSWNAVFFIFGNRYIYFLFIVPVFLILIDDIANGGNLRYCTGRLTTKANIIKAQINVMLLLSLFLTIYVFGVVVIESFLSFGATLEWSVETKSGIDPYTAFFEKLTPLHAISLFMIRYFSTLIFLGGFYFYWQSKTKRQHSAIGFLMILLLLFFNAILNFYNVPVLNALDLSFVYVYNVKLSETFILIHMVTSQLSLVILSFGLIFFALRLSREVNL